MRANGPAIRALRERTGISQAQLARNTEIDTTIMSRIESGARSGTDRQIVLIARCLDVPVTAVTRDACTSCTAAAVAEVDAA